MNFVQILKVPRFLALGLLFLLSACRPAELIKVTPQDLSIKNPADEKTSPLKSLGHSKLPFQWDKIIRVENEVDGLIVNHVVFNQKKSLFTLKNTEIKVVAHVQVTNASTVDKYPSFSLAVFNEEGTLVGVASGGTWIKGVKPKETMSFALDFEPMKERVPLGTIFHLSVELK